MLVNQLDDFPNLHLNWLVQNHQKYPSLQNCLVFRKNRSICSSAHCWQVPGVQDWKQRLLGNSQGWWWGERVHSGFPSTLGMGIFFGGMFLVGKKSWKCVDVLCWSWWTFCSKMMWWFLMVIFVNKQKSHASLPWQWKKTPKMFTGYCFDRIIWSLWSTSSHWSSARCDGGRISALCSCPWLA